MTHARCCAECAKGSCCEFAGATWRNRYCLEVSGEYFAEICTCGVEDGCFGAGCDDCNDDGLFCCREYEFRWCVGGPIFRYPRGFDAVCVGCDTAQSSPTQVYSTCKDPWVAPDWGIGERGCSSEYKSALTDFTSCTPCATAPAADRIRYQVVFRTTSVAGNGCGYATDIDEAYTVEGYARIECAATGSEGGCDDDYTYTHRLIIEPCGDPTPLPKPPILVYVANLAKSTPPHAANVWVLEEVSFSYLTPQASKSIPFGGANNPACEVVPPSGNYNEPCSPDQSECLGWFGESLTMSNLTVSTAYPCEFTCGQFE